MPAFDPMTPMAGDLIKNNGLGSALAGNMLEIREIVSNCVLLLLLLL